MRRALAALAVAGAALAGSGCPDGGGGAADRPPRIRYGADACDECQMIISEARFAAATVTAAGEAHRFDDLGDMLAYHRRTGEDVAAYWVHDLDTAEWLRAERATFVRAPTFPTPMASGLVAFADPARARAFAQEHGGEVIEFAHLLGPPGSVAAVDSAR